MLVAENNRDATCMLVSGWLGVSVGPSSCCLEDGPKRGTGGHVASRAREKKLRMQHETVTCPYLAGRKLVPPARLGSGVSSSPIFGTGGS